MWLRRWRHTGMVQFALLAVTCPCRQKGTHWGRPCSHSPPPLSPQPLKSCAAMCTALMFALYPPCKAIIIHASWQSQAAFVTSAARGLGRWHDCTVDLSSFTYRSPCLSLCFSACRFCTLFRCDDLLSLVPLKPLRHLAHFHAFSRWIALQRSNKKKVHLCSTRSAALESSVNVDVHDWFSLFLFLTQTRTFYTTFVFIAS